MAESIGVPSFVGTASAQEVIMDPASVVETTFHVRYAETDQMGVVHHSVYIVWFEEGRSAWLRARGTSYAEVEASGHFFAVSEVHVRYLAPARYDRAVTVRTWPARLGSRGFTLEYEVVDAESGQLLATGSTRHICLDREGRVARIPEAWRKVLTS